MKAIVHAKYGPPDVLDLEEIEKPMVEDDEVLVQVHAAGIAIGDWLVMRGLPYPARTTYGLRKPKNLIPGFEISGHVEAIGTSVKRFQPGDEVFGWCNGALAEYVSVSEDALAPKPANLTFEQAAAVPISAFTALQGLRDHGQIEPGQKVLVIGASGGVGTFAVQIAKAFGAEVTGVCSTRNVDLVRSIGADHVIDYTQDDFTQSGQRYDLILDTVGNRSLADTRRGTHPTGLARDRWRIGRSVAHGYGSHDQSTHAVTVHPPATARIRFDAECCGPERSQGADGRWAGDTGHRPHVPPR